MRLNSKKNLHKNAGNINDIVAYTIDGDIFVGIDLKTGFFLFKSKIMPEEVYMDYKIRKLKKDEIRILEIFLYEAIFIPEGVEPPQKDIINHPDLNIYISNFGGKTDLCYVAEVSEKIKRAGL